MTTGSIDDQIDIGMHALLVGINDWKYPKQIKSLKGCHNDVSLMQSILQKTFGEERTSISKLHDQEATADGIAAAFRSHLIEPARIWFENNPGKAHESPAFLFHYSGHGTQVSAPANSKASGLDETLCTWDMEKGKNFGLRDWQLGDLIAELTKYTDNVTIILDCCHSGSGTRDIDESLTPRQAEPDLSPPPKDLRPPSRSASRGDSDEDEGFRLAVSERSVLMAACKSTQKAFEYTHKKTANTDDSKPSPPKVNGAFTYSLSQALANLPPGKVPTYDELYRKTCRFLSYKSRSQRPQLEGGRERTLFGTQVKPRDLWMSIRSEDKKAGRYEVDGGLCHGITVGSELAGYKNATREADKDRVLSKLRVVESEAVRCFCEPIGSEQIVFLDMPVGVLKLVPDDTRRTVKLESEMLDRLTKHNDPLTTSVVDLVSEGPADLILSRDGDVYALKDAENRFLEEVPANVDDTALARILNRWARYFAALDISNDSVGPGLADKVSIRLLNAPSKSENNPIEHPSGEVIRIEHGAIVRIEVENTSKVPLYITILAFTASGEVQMMYPTEAGHREQLRPNEPYRTGRYRLMINGDQLMDSTDTLKVIATKEEADFSLLCVEREWSGEPPETHRSLTSNKVPSSLSGLLKIGAMSSNHRDLIALDDEEEGDDTWVVSEVSYRLVRPVSQTTATFSGNEKKEIGNSGVQIESPSGFSGEISIVSSAQSAITNAMKPKWIRKVFADGLQPVPLASASPKDDELWFVQIKPKPNSGSAIDAESPLKLWLPKRSIRKDDEVQVIANDNDTAVVVGKLAANGECVQIERLPETAEVRLYVFNHAKCD